MISYDFSDSIVLGVLYETTWASSYINMYMRVTWSLKLAIIKIAEYDFWTVHQSPEQWVFSSIEVLLGGGGAYAPCSLQYLILCSLLPSIFQGLLLFSICSVLHLNFPLTPW